MKPPYLKNIENACHEAEVIRSRNTICFTRDVREMLKAWDEMERRIETLESQVKAGKEVAA